MTGEKDLPERGNATDHAPLDIPWLRLCDCAPLNINGHRARLDPIRVKMLWGNGRHRALFLALEIAFNTRQGKR